MKRIFEIIFILCIFTAGCTGIDGTAGTDTGSGKLVEFRITCRETGENTRSSIDADESEIRDIRICAYSEGRLQADAYSGNHETSIGLTLISGQVYNIYAIANAGKISIPSDEEDIKTLNMSISSVSDFGKTGFPMAASIMDLRIGSDTRTVDLFLTRLVSKIEFMVDKERLSGLTIKTVSLKQSPKDIFPFTDGSAATGTIDGDCASSIDVEAINNGSPAVFYMFENCQGVLLPGNNDPWNKIPDNIDDKAALCTYIEVTAELDDSGELTGPVTYRFFLGQDNTSDFNIFRNTCNTVTLTVTEDALSRLSWRIDTSGLEPVKRLPDNKYLGFGYNDSGNAAESGHYSDQARLKVVTSAKEAELPSGMTWELRRYSKANGNMSPESSWNMGKADDRCSRISITNDGIYLTLHYGNAGYPTYLASGPYVIRGKYNEDGTERYLYYTVDIITRLYMIYQVETGISNNKSTVHWNCVPFSRMSTRQNISRGEWDWLDGIFVRENKSGKIQRLWESFDKPFGPYTADSQYTDNQLIEKWAPVYYNNIGIGESASGGFDLNAATLPDRGSIYTEYYELNIGSYPYKTIEQAFNNFSAY